MDFSHLPADERAKVHAWMLRKPRSKKLFARILEERAALKSDEERARLDALTISLVTPTRFSAGGALLAAVVMMPIAVIGGLALYDRHTLDAALQVGIPVVARVESLDEGMCILGTEGSECLRLTLRVWPSSGASYVGTVDHDIDNTWLSRVQPGSYLTVVVDPANPDKLTFDERTMHVAPPPPPAAASTP